MKNDVIEVASQDAQAVEELYHAAAQQLLLAYQRNKQATRHHGAGAIKAALYHARMSCVHAAAANECLIQALEKSGQLLSPSLTNREAAKPAVVWRSH